MCIVDGFVYCWLIRRLGFDCLYVDFIFVVVYVIVFGYIGVWCFEFDFGLVLLDCDYYCWLDLFRCLLGLLTAGF